MESGSIDGSLIDWGEVADAEEWQGLLLGNGLSVNVWPNFVYDSLFDHAQDAASCGRAQRTSRASDSRFDATWPEA